MAQSVVSICNQALGHIGHSEPITSIDEASEAAAACKNYFEQVRDELLAAHDWWFARRRVVLALVATDPNDDWAFAYRRPNDCVTARKVQQGTSRFSAPLPWEAGGDDAGGLIFTDEASAGLDYIARVTNPSHWTALFCSALSWRLAIEIGPILSESAGDLPRLRDGFERALGSAKVHAANEGVPDPQPDADAILARA